MVQPTITPVQKTLRFIGEYILIRPFLFVVGFFDFIIGLILPYKYEDSALPDKNATLAKRVDESEAKSPYRSTMCADLIRLEGKDTNLYSRLAECVKAFFDMETMGVREIITIDDEVQPNGKVFKKYNLASSYTWSTYEQTFARINNFSNGLLHVGLKSDQNIVLFAETRPEWIMTAFACFRIKVPIVTLYSTLGIEALAFGINQTSAPFVVTSGEQLPKLAKIMKKIPNITHVVVFNDLFTEKNLAEFKKTCPLSVQVYTVDDVEKIGREGRTIEEFKSPVSDDLAIIMYTSGSTGNPKGVMISHRNILTSMDALITRLGTVNQRKDIYVAYLPLAHILELVCELTCMTNGVRVGYSSPLTIADTSTAIKKGQKGDLRVLKPTIMASVPIVLERLSKTVYEKLSHTNWFKQTLFQLAYKTKLDAFHAGRSSRLLDRVLFKRISRAVLGGKCRLMLSGGAILVKEVHEFVQVCLCPVIQAYGLTETCAAATTQLPNQTVPEVVGSVVPCCELRLVDWPEGGYRSTDKPNPRGEVYIGGDNVTLGYYNMAEKTAEDFSVSKDGIRYFATGDIGEVLPSGDLKIIDRKKDLVKLQGGEYVSLNKVESFIKLLSLVDNCCVIADPTKANCVLLACGNVKKAREMLLKSEESVSVEDLVKELNTNKAAMQSFVKEMTDHCLKQGLERFEIPTRVCFVKEAWLPDSGLVTDSLKLKRKEIEKFYAKEIAALYK